MLRDQEILAKLEMNKFEDEVDGLQKFMRDLNLKFSDCQNRLLKQLEINAIKGSQLSS